MSLLEFVQCAFAVGQDIESAGSAFAFIEDEIGDDVLFLEGKLEQFAGEESPVAGEGEIGRLERGEVGGEFRHQQAAIEGWHMFGRVCQTQSVGAKLIKRMETRSRGMSQLEGWARPLAESSLDTLGLNPPIHLKAVGGKSNIQSIAHVAIFRAAVGDADRAKFGDVEIGIAAEKRVVGPGDTIKPLMAHHLPLGAFEREAHAPIAVVGMDAHHVRAVLWARTVGREVETGEAEDKADHLVFAECAEDESAVVDGGDEHVQRHNVGLGIGPHNALEFFHKRHFFGRFDQADGEHWEVTSHELRGRREASLSVTAFQAR